METRFQFRRYLLIGTLMTFLVPTIEGQNDKNKKKLTGLSTVLLPQGRMELNLINTFTPDNKVFNFVVPPYRYIRNQETWSLNSRLNFTFGAFDGAFLNFGLDVDNTIFNQKITNELKDTTYSVSSIGPRIRWKLLEIRDLDFEIVIENGVSYSLNGEADFTKLQINNNILINKLIYLYSFDADIIVQAQVGFNLLPKRVEDSNLDNPIATPATLLVGLFPNNEWLIFVGGTYLPIWGTVPWAVDEPETVFRRSSSVQGFGGIQYSISNIGFLYASYNHQIYRERNDGGHSFSLGYRMFLGQ